MPFHRKKSDCHTHFYSVCNSVWIALMIQAARISETSFYFNKTTRRYNPESCHPQHYGYLNNKQTCT
jgi:hypothetical protein